MSATAAALHHNHDVAHSLSTVALPWTTSRPLALPKQLGDGIDLALLKQGLQRLIVYEGVGTVVLFGSRAQDTARADSDLDLAVICQGPELTSQQRTQRWRIYRKALGPLGCGVDLVLQGQSDAARLAVSRWHVMKDVARHGVVLYASL
ncbi:hypothetical protein SynA18461_00514 [Synechococcus sp. A18-46.1]|nr:hypothetical protein SynA18461_00514 [Synechococcus sp. A18-46.1]